MIPPAAARANTLKTLGIAARPTLLFVVAFALSITPHEAAHALTGYLLGFNSTIFQMWVNPDRAGATPAQLATIAAAGPIFSLTAGTICWLFYASRFKRRPFGLVFLMLVLVGIDSFLGPMAGAAFGGDFHTAFGFLGTPAWACVAVSITGFVLLAAFMFQMGQELEGWVPRDFGRVPSVLGATVAPPVIGTLLALSLYWPLPGILVRSTLGGSAIWVFAVIGAAFAVRRPHPDRELRAFTRADAVLAIAAVVMVRIFAMGIRLAR